MTTTSNLLDIDDDDDLQPTDWDRSSFRRKNIRRKSYVRLREPSIVKRLQEVTQEANILESGLDEHSPETDEEVEKSESPGSELKSTRTPAPKVFVHYVSTPNSEDKPPPVGYRFHDEVPIATRSVLSAPELDEDQIFDSSCGSDNAFTSEYLDKSKRVIKPSISIADLLNSSGSSLSSRSSSESSVSENQNLELSLEEIVEAKSSYGDDLNMCLEDRTLRRLRTSQESMFSVEKHEKVDIRTFINKPTLSRNMSWTCPRLKPGEIGTPSKTRKLKGRVLGKEVTNDLEHVLRDGDKRSAMAVANWLFDEGFIKPCKGGQRSFEVNFACIFFFRY